MSNEKDRPKGAEGFAGLFGPGSRLYKEWEDQASVWFEKLTRSDSFLENVGKALEGSFVFKAAFDRWMESYLKAMRLPTVGDLEQVHKRLDELERRLDRMDERAGGGEQDEP